MGFVNKAGKDAIPPIYDYVEHWGQNIIAAKKLNGYYAFMNEMGELLTPFKYVKVVYTGYNCKSSAQSGPK